MTSLRVIGTVAFLVFLLGIISASLAGKQDKAGAPSIREGEVPVGYFGLPMGTSLTIEGMAVHKVMMRSGTTIQVDTVNGQRLPTPIAVVVENIYPPNGVRCVVKGYELGGMIGLPPAHEELAREEARNQGKEFVGAQCPWAFQWKFIATSVLSPKEVKIQR